MFYCYNLQKNIQYYNSVSFIICEILLNNPAWAYIKKLFGTYSELFRFLEKKKNGKSNRPNNRKGENAEHQKFMFLVKKIVLYTMVKVESIRENYCNSYKRQIARGLQIRS